MSDAYLFIWFCGCLRLLSGFYSGRQIAHVVSARPASFLGEVWASESLRVKPGLLSFKTFAGEFVGSLGLLYFVEFVCESLDCLKMWIEISAVRAIVTFVLDIVVIVISAACLAEFGLDLGFVSDGCCLRCHVRNLHTILVMARII